MNEAKQTKVVEIAGESVVLQSLDGRTWSSSLDDARAFASRTESALSTLAGCIVVIAGIVARSERAAVREWKQSVDRDRHRSGTFRVRDQGQIRDEP